MGCSVQEAPPQAMSLKPNEQGAEQHGCGCSRLEGVEIHKLEYFWKTGKTGWLGDGVGDFPLGLFYAF